MNKPIFIVNNIKVPLNDSTFIKKWYNRSRWNPSTM